MGEWRFEPLTTVAECWRRPLPLNAGREDEVEDESEDEVADDDGNAVDAFVFVDVVVIGTAFELSKRACACALQFGDGC